MARVPRLLLTGFGPFPGAPRNPTAEVVARVTARGERLGVEIVPHVFATTWAALDGVEGLLARSAPDVALHLGLAGRARVIRVETVARNRIATWAVDAAGCAGPAGWLDPKGAARLAARLPVRAIAARIGALGLSTELSDDAGSYLCNALLWRSLAGSGDRPTGFLHLPPLRGAKGAVSTFVLDDLVTAVAATIRLLAACHR